MPFKQLGRPFLGESIDVGSMTEQERFEFLHDLLEKLEKYIKKEDSLIREEFNETEKRLMDHQVTFMSPALHRIDKIDSRLDNLEKSFNQQIADKVLANKFSGIRRTDMENIIMRLDKIMSRLNNEKTDKTG